MSLPVSVVVPGYNAAGTLRRALASAFAQRPDPPAEVIVVDDGSRDATAELARSLGATVLVHERNRGLGATRNTAVEAASQPWLAFLDADDEWLPHHLATVWAARDDHDFVAGSALTWSEDGGRSRFHGALRRSELVLHSPTRLLAVENYVAVSAAIARTEAVRDVGAFRPAHSVEDLDLWCRLLGRGSGAVVPAVTIVYHVHPGQMSSDVGSMQRAHLDVIASHAGAPWWTPQLAERYRGAVAWTRAVHAWSRGDRRQAVGILARTLLDAPRARGLADFLARRALARREAARWSRDGSRAGLPPDQAAVAGLERVRRVAREPVRRAG